MIVRDEVLLLPPPLSPRTCSAAICASAWTLLHRSCDATATRLRRGCDDRTNVLERRVARTITDRRRSSSQMTATMSTCEHARFHPRSNSHAHTVAHTRAFAKILAHTRVRARACQCTGQQGAALGQVLLLPCAEDPRRVLADARLRLGLPRELQPPHLPVGSRPPASAEEYEEYPLEYQEYPGGLPPASISGRQALGRRSSIRIRRAVAAARFFNHSAPSWPDQGIILL
jgi:hypothetical protein